MERKQFTFYESWYTSISRIKKAADRAKAYDTICTYALRGIEPDIEDLPDIVAVIFENAKPNIDASRKKAESGKKGGESKQGASNAEANRKQAASEKEKEDEKENEKENEIEKENECYSARADANLAKVMTYFLDKINATPSSSCIDELKHYTAELSADVVLHAFGRAQDEGKTGWSYIRGILQNYAKQKLTTLNAVLEAEKAHRAKKDAKGVSVQSNNAPTTAADMSRMQNVLERIVNG